MLKALKRLFKGKRLTSEDMLNDLRTRGAQIGTDVVVYSPSTTILDGANPFLLTIGDHVRITAGVKVLTHDYSWSAMKTYASENVTPGAILGSQAVVKIGSYVFIGMNAVVTPGVTIGDHVIIGAGSVVTKDCESGGVYAGNPARKIATLEDFYQKRKARQFEEAKAVAIRYYERFGKNPPRELFREYFMLFAAREEADQTPEFRFQMALLGSYDETAAYMDQHQPMFAGYGAFLKACGLHEVQ